MPLFFKKRLSLSKKVAAIALFSGAGGLDLGARMAGVDVISCIDFEHDAVETLRLNNQFNKTDLHEASIVGFDTKQFLNRYDEKKHSGLIVIGGPPCQPFSKNGYWIKNDNRLIMDDPRNMFHEYFRVISELKPDGFLLENVESLMHPSNKEAVDYIMFMAKLLGYNYKLVRANAADFGVPQRRKRIFFIGSLKKEITSEPKPTHCDPKKAGLFKDLPPHVGVGKFIKAFAGPEYFEKEEVATEGTYYGDLVQVPPGKNYLTLTANAGYPNPKFVAGKRFWNFLLKLSPEITSWTIAASPGPWVGPFHWDNRRLRVPEIAAIQTFPKGYKFYGKRRSIQKQLGNAVPPKLAKVMVGFLIKNI